MPDPASGVPRPGVLITRAAAEAARTAALVTARGYHPIEAPLIQVRHRAPLLPVTVQAILVTSGNALAGVPARDVKLLAVGDSTAEKARAAGFSRVSSAGRDATALVALAAGQLDPAAGPLLLLSGTRQGADVAAGLRRAGFAVWRRVTYAASPVASFPPQAASAFAEGQLHAAIFMSGETAHAFVRLLPRTLLPKLANVLALAIGNGSADALKPLPWREIRAARTPTLDDVLALL